MPNNHCLTLAIAAIGLWASAPVLAADMKSPVPVLKAPAPASPSTWEFQATPYVWVPLFNGSATVRGRASDVDVGYRDIIDLVRHSEIPKDLFGLMGQFEARSGRFSIFTDLVYLKVGLGANMVRSRGVDALNAAVGVAAKLKFDMFIAEMAAAYEVAQWGSTGVRGSGTAIDIYGGARAWWQTADVSLAVAGTVNILDLSVNRNGTLSASGEQSWLDPLVGVRLRHQFAPGWNFVASGDVGGFGVGSKSSWQALASLSYDFSVRDSVTWSAVLGYKALHVDYSKGSGLARYEYDMKMHGPIFGVTARF